MEILMACHKIIQDVTGFFTIILKIWLGSLKTEFLKTVSHFLIASVHMEVSGNFSIYFKHSTTKTLEKSWGSYIKRPRPL